LAGLAANLNHVPTRSTLTWAAQSVVVQPLLKRRKSISVLPHDFVRMSLFLQLPAELLDIVFHNFFLEEWIDSKEKYNLALKLRAVSRGCFRRPTQ
jgi:hypothetical protein